MIATGATPRAQAPEDFVELSDADAPEMQALAQLTEPGPSCMPGKPTIRPLRFTSHLASRFAPTSTLPCSNGTHERERQARQPPSSRRVPR